MTTYAAPVRLALALGLLLVGTVPAFAHVTIRPQQAQPGGSQRYTVRVPTEGQVATTSVELDIPDGVTVTEIVSGPDFTYDTVTTSDRITRISWRRTIPAGQAAEFLFVATNPVNTGRLVWRAHQRFADGTVADWIGPAGTPRPAPVVTLELPEVQ